MGYAVTTVYAGKAEVAEGFALVAFTIAGAVAGMGVYNWWLELELATGVVAAGTLDPLWDQCSAGYGATLAVLELPPPE